MIYYPRFWRRYSLLAQLSVIPSELAAPSLFQTGLRAIESGGHFSTQRNQGIGDTSGQLRTITCQIQQDDE